MTSLRNWLAKRMGAPLGSAPDAQRWIVLDVETTGLDPQSDRLLCVAALAVHFSDQGPSLHAHDSFEVVLRQEAMAASHDNVLLHGIGWGQQRQGMPAAEALQRLHDWVGTSPMLAYHAGFDRAVLRCRRAVSMPGCARSACNARAGTRPPLMCGPLPSCCSRPGRTGSAKA
jgi:DNA polymerase-3 subunit epsilon